MNVLVQLNPPLGAGVGPNFNLTANVGTVVPSTATATQLLAGIIAVVSNTATILNIVPNGGACPTTISLNLPALPTTTTSTSTTTIAPLCQCILIYNTNNSAKTIQYRDCSNQLVGLPLAANGSMQVCGSNVTPMDGVDVTLGGPCASSQNGYVCTSCAAEKCSTYLIVNTSTSSQTFQYTDCTGASTTATVQGRVSSSNGQINICSCNIIEFPVGSVLQASDISVDCILCKCYKIYNPTQGTLNYTWTDCEKGDPNVEPIVAGEIQYKCSLSNGFTPNPALIVTAPDSACLVLGAIGNISPSLLPICDEPQSYCYTVTITGSVIIQYVNSTGILTIDSGTNTTLYLCAWQNSIIKTGGSGTLTVSAAGSVCQFAWQCEPCFCYTVYNKTGSSKTLSYVDCSLAAVVTQVIANNSSFNYCGKYPLNPDDFTSVLKGASCNPGGSCSQITTTTIAPYTACFRDCCDDTIFSIFNIPGSILVGFGETYYITTTFGGPSKCCTLYFIGVCIDAAPGYSYSSLTTFASCATCIAAHPCPITTTTAAPTTTTTTTLVTSCYRIANSTTSPIVATYYDATGFPNFVTIPAQTGTTYQCASSVTPQSGLTIATVGNCSYFKCAGITTTTSTTAPPCLCVTLSSEECSYFSYTTCAGVFVPSVFVCTTPLTLCGYGFEDLGILGTITINGPCGVAPCI